MTTINYPEVSRPVRTDVQPVLSFVQELNEGYSPRNFALRFWDGTVVDPEPGQEARFTMVFKHPGAARQAFWPFDPLAFGEAYIYGDFDIEGDIKSFHHLARYWENRHLSATLGKQLHLLYQLLRLPKQALPRPAGHRAKTNGRRRSESSDQDAIQYHYDGPPSTFYRQMLGKQMQYSCGYFATPDDDIETAQERKLDYICRKLQLTPGERLIDFGCGWGGLIIHAAKHYGVEAVGVSVAAEQIEWANRWIREEGLQDRCRVEFCDYRKVPEDKPFDKAVSVGFIEHVGDKNMPIFFDKVWRLLRPGGRYLNHGITMKPHIPQPKWNAFVHAYVFPNGELVTINRTLDHLAKTGFEIRDVEDLREHYMYTLTRWLERLEDRADQIKELVDEITYRIYRIYIAGAANGFKWNIYHLNQTLVVKSGKDVSGLPLTRADWYR